jgi:hypothetical protein
MQNSRADPQAESGTPSVSSSQIGQPEPPLPALQDFQPNPPADAPPLAPDSTDKDQQKKSGATVKKHEKKPRAAQWSDPGPTCFHFPPDVVEQVSIGCTRQVESLVVPPNQKNTSHAMVMTSYYKAALGLTRIPLMYIMSLIYRLSQLKDVIITNMTWLIDHPDEFDARFKVQCLTCLKTIFLIYSHGWEVAFLTVKCNGICHCPVWQNLFDSKPVGRGGNNFFYINLLSQFNELQRPKPFKSWHVRRFGKWLLKRCRVEDVMTKEWLELRCLSRTTLRGRRLLAGHCRNLTEFIDNRLAKTGYVKVFLAPVDPTTHKPKTKYTYQGQDIGCLMWIPDWAITTYEKASYVQLDCSFRATKPFAYCVPQAMICNEAVPLGFILTPRESAVTYSTFMEELWGLKQGPWDMLPVLSDQGKGLESFCIGHEIEQFFCHRHIIELFGAASTAGMLASRVLRIQTKEHFDGLHKQFVADAEELYNKGLMSKKALNRFLGWVNAFTDGIWNRDYKGIARCSNHAERFHGVVNNYIRQNRRKTLVARLECLFRAVEDSHASYGNGWERQIPNTLAVLRRQKLEPREECNDPECVAYREMMRIRYGVPSFPCAHTLQTYVRTVPDYPGIRDDANEQLVRNAGLVRVDIDNLPEENPQKTVFRPKRKAPTPRSCAIIEWDDENRPLHHVLEPDSSVPFHETARNIVTSVFEMRARARTLPPIDKITASFLILKHYQESFAEAAAQGIFTTDVATRRWLAQYGAAWCQWAAHGTECPLGEGLPNQPEGVPEEDGFDEGGPILRFVDTAQDTHE